MHTADRLRTTTRAWDHRPSRPVRSQEPVMRQGDDPVHIQPDRMPVQIEVGERANYRFDISSTVVVGLSDPNWCLKDFQRSGMDVTAVALIGPNTAASQSYCLASSAVVHPPESFEFNLTGRSEGDVQLTIEVYGNGSGELLSMFQETITVGSGGDGGNVDPDDPPTNGNGDGGGPWLPCILDPNHACSGTETVALAVGGAMFGIVGLNVLLD